MTVKFGKSTLGAMAPRNTKVANIAKRSIASFKTGVLNLMKKINDNLTEEERQKLLTEVKKIQNQRNGVLTALNNYSEELQEKKESFSLYDSLLDEFKDFMNKLDDINDKLINNDKISITMDGISPSSTTSPIMGEQVFEQTLPAHMRYELESDVLNERSQQIQQLRSSVYGIQDLYEEIGEMVEYQGDQLDSIENNMYNSYLNTRDANVVLRDMNRGSSLPRSKYYVLILFFFVVILSLLVYRKI